MNHWRDIVEDQLQLISKTGLYNKTNKILVGCVGPTNEKELLNKMLPEKYELVFHDEDIELAEIPTLQCLQDACQHDNFLVWYAHTKGVFSEYRPNHKPHVLKWRKM